MKKKTKTIQSVAAIIFAAGIIFLAGCQKDSDQITPQDDAAVITPDNDAERCGHSAVFPVNAHMFGKSYGQWGAEWWKWNLQFDCTHIPYLDTDGSLQNQGQHGPVYFLGGAPFLSPMTRNVTIPPHKSLFFSLLVRYDSDTVGLAASGKSLYDFLYTNVSDPVNGVNILTCTLDGQNIANNLFDYRAHSRLFNFTGNLDLNNCTSYGVSGTQETAVTDGYWIMLKPLHHGQHVLHFTGGIAGAGPGGIDLVKDVTYTITQQ